MITEKHHHSLLLCGCWASTLTLLSHLDSSPNKILCPLKLFVYAYACVCMCGVCSVCMCSETAGEEAVHPPGITIYFEPCPRASLGGGYPDPALARDPQQAGVCRVFHVLPKVTKHKQHIAQTVQPCESHPCGRPGSWSPATRIADLAPLNIFSSVC